MCTLVIDAINIRKGGGVTHLQNILREADYSNFKFKKIIIYGSSDLLRQLNVSNDCIITINYPFFDRSSLYLFIWQLFKFKKELKKHEAKVVFVPGGTFLYFHDSVVTMSRNMLPIELSEAWRYGISFTFFRLVALRLFTIFSFYRSAGFIFLNESAFEKFKSIGLYKSLTANSNWFNIIPHGIEDRIQKVNSGDSKCFNFGHIRSMKVIYVSIIDVYKHQDIVCEAFDKLIKLGFNLELELVGPEYTPALNKLNRKLSLMSKKTLDRITYHGNLGIDEQMNLYNSCDLILFGSTCENLPNILLEGMRTGLPIVCSNYNPMPEILGEGAVYFDPTLEESIISAIRKVYTSSELRATISKESYSRSLAYSWKKCALQTFNYLESFNKEGKCVV
jgi:glycosyltransferase involved in cell wall biosynthesis